MTLVLKALITLALVFARPLGVHSLGVGVSVRVIESHRCELHDLALMANDSWTYSEPARTCPADVGLGLLSYTGGD